MQRIYILIFFSCLANFLQAQTFSSKKIAEIGELFPKTCLPAKDSIFNCPQIIKEKQLVVQYNNKKEIEHLGVSLFSPEIKEMISVPVCNFIERLTLELLLQKTAANVNKRLQEYGVSFEERNSIMGTGKPLTITRLLNKLHPPVQFTLQHQDFTYHASWILESGEEFVLTFPASRELIFGTNKKESDQSLSERLPENRCNYILEDYTLIQDNDLEPTSYNPNVFLRKGHDFTIPDLNSNTYFSKDYFNCFYPLFDFNYPALSLKNLLLIPDIETMLKLRVKHRMYGSFTPEFEVNPSDFICFFQAEFDIYAHVDDSKQDALIATVVLYNRMYGYMHLLTIKTSVNTLFEKNGIIKAEFYSNIPQHNIKNLFAD